MDCDLYFDLPIDRGIGFLFFGDNTIHDIFISLSMFSYDITNLSTHMVSSINRYGSLLHLESELRWDILSF